MPFIIAIDGPAGAGKSTVARKVALRLNYDYLDTGAMYRAVALRSIEASIPPNDSQKLATLAATLNITFLPLQADGKQTVLLDGQDVSLEIRTPEVSQRTSEVSKLATVREVVVALQRGYAAKDIAGIVLEGRDIGTVVFPKAQLKVFLTATPEERARRRTAELKERGIDASYSQTLAEILERDARDSGRSASPLKQAEDAKELLSDNLTIAQVVERIVDWRDEIIMGKIDSRDETKQPSSYTGR